MKEDGGDPSLAMPSSDSPTQPKRILDSPSESPKPQKLPRSVEEGCGEGREGMSQNPRLQRYLVAVEYIGTRFSGSQRQPNCRTVVGVLEVGGVNLHVSFAESGFLLARKCYLMFFQLLSVVKPSKIYNILTLRVLRNIKAGMPRLYVGWSICLGAVRDLIFIKIYSNSSYMVLLVNFKQSYSIQASDITTH